MANDDPINRPAAVDPRDDIRVDAIAHAPVGFGAQHVTDSGILFPDGSDHGYVLTIGGSVAYVTEETMESLARAVLHGRVHVDADRPKPGPRR